MQKHKIQRKNTYWELYNHIFRRIGIGVVVIIIVAIPGYFLCLYSNEIGKFLSNETFLYSFAAVISVIFIGCSLYEVYVFSRYFSSQRYIPLTKEELIENNITSCSDYNNFLESFLYKFGPIESIRIKICKTAFLYLMNDDDKYNVFIKYYSVDSKKFESEIKQNANNMFKHIQAMTDEEVLAPDSGTKLDKIIFWNTLGSSQDINPIAYCYNGESQTAYVIAAVGIFGCTLSMWATSIQELQIVFATLNFIFSGLYVLNKVERYASKLTKKRKELKNEKL